VTLRSRLADERLAAGCAIRVSRDPAATQAWGPDPVGGAGFVIRQAIEARELGPMSADELAWMRRVGVEVRRRAWLKQ
jgi:hypothetical protein